MDLIELRRALRRFWLLSAVVFLLTVGAGYVLATSGDLSFQSVATISVEPNPAEEGSAERLAFEIPVIVETVGSRSFRTRLDSLLPGDVMADISSLTGVNEPATGIVRITARGSERDAVSDVANTAAAEIIANYPPTDDDPLTPPTKGDLVVVQIIDDAVEDSGSGRANLIPILIGSVALGAILAVAAAAMAQKFSRSRDVISRIRTEIGIPVLAVIPASRELEANDVDLNQLLTSGPAALVEAFQGLRTRTEYVLTDGESTLAVTSWQRKEGRTTVTAGLGLMLAAIGHQTVIIDTDLRRPKLHERLGEPLAKGISEFDELGRGYIARQTRQANLGLVTAGVPESHPAQILAVALPAVLGAIRERLPQSFILLDAPPLGPVRKDGLRVQRAAETTTVLRAAHKILLVIDASNSRLTELTAGVERLQEEGVIVVGAVVNERRRSFRRSQ